MTNRLYSLSDTIAKRRTFAIISHPDAGKTTVTEKMLLQANAIQLAGSVRAKKTGRQAKSDWMAMEQERGISVTTSVMQFQYGDCVVNLLDTPGHEDFSEDTYRTLTAVDSAIMVIDAAKGVEPRTRKLLEICRLRDTPILTFINKLDREALDPLELLDEIESDLQINCAPRTWPIGSGRYFRGCYEFEKKEFIEYETGHDSTRFKFARRSGIHSEATRNWLAHDYEPFAEELELVQGASHAFDVDDYLQGNLTPVYFGSALQNFGIDQLLNEFVTIAPTPQPRATDAVEVHPTEDQFSGFVFKIQANMNPKHRDRIAFMRICSGSYRKGMRMKHVRLQREVKISDAVTFMAGDRSNAETAYAGDIIGLHNHGTIQIGDSFTEKADLNFKGIPNFAPDLFRKVRVKDPMKSKRLVQGIKQLAEEGASQVFFPLDNNDVVIGAIGSLQFDLVAFRLEGEYGAECFYEDSRTHTVRWVSSDDPVQMREFQRKLSNQLAFDGDERLAFLATSRANLNLVQERWPEIKFANTREHAVGT